MIIEARDDVVTLSGRLETNLWLSIQDAAQMLLWGHPNGILIDASEITKCTPEGAITFLDAIDYIQRHRARIVLCKVPESIMQVIRTVPELRSQIASATSLDEARHSLELAAKQRTKERRKKADDGSASILVPVFPGTENIRCMLALAHIIGSESPLMHPGGAEEKAKVLLTYIMTVPRSASLNSPMPEQEEEAKSMIDEAQTLADKFGLNLAVSVTRTRDLGEEIVRIAAEAKVEKILLAMPDDNDHAHLEVILDKAPCEVLLTSIR